jgi:hypothetical protein
MLNRLGIELRDLNRPARPITMPAFNLPVVDDGAERREIAARFAEHPVGGNLEALSVGRDVIITKRLFAKVAKM